MYVQICFDGVDEDGSQLYLVDFQQKVIDSVADKRREAERRLREEEEKALREEERRKEDEDERRLLAEKVEPPENSEDM